MKNKILILLLLCLSMTSFAQKKYIADMYFEDYAYVKSAELYEKISEKENSQLVLSRLSDSYYFNSEMQKAEYSYKKLIENFGAKVSKEHFFRYAQVLKSNGYYKKSDSIFKKYFKNSLINSIPEKEYNNENYISNILSHSNEKKVIVHNLSSNTSYSDFGGFMQKDVFYFASTAPKSNKKSKIYKWNNQPYLNLYSSTTKHATLVKDSTQVAVIELNKKSLLPKIINSKYHEASMVLTKDGKTMYFTRDNYDGRKLRRNKKSVAMLKIYKATLIDNKWKNITELPFNSDEYSTGHPALSTDEKTLYFVSDRPGGFGNTDIYKASISSDNTFGEVKNLGNKINTIGREMFPSISAKQILYFSSDGHKGVGALDIFEVQLEENDEPLVVKNLNAPFNSNLDDFGFVVEENSSKGFFSSNRAGGKGDDDIYSFSIYTSKNTILDSIIENKAPVNKIDIDTKNENIADSVSAKKLNKKHSIETSLIKGSEINSPIHFDFDSYRISKDAVTGLEKVVALMKNNPELVIKIESHTDSRGSRAYNKTLSGKRAKATRDYIISKGVDAKKIESAIGYGEDKLLETCENSDDKKCSKKQHELNRRSYFYIVKDENNLKLKDDNNETSVAKNKKEKQELYKKDSKDHNKLIANNQILTNDIRFDFNKYNIRTDALIELEKVVSVMTDNPAMVIKIESHTDSRGSKAYNKILSDKRAKSTRDYIISKGIDAKRIESAIGYGEEQLLNNCNDKNQKKCSEIEHQLNRRAYFYILKNKQHIVSSIDTKNH